MSLNALLNKLVRKSPWFTEGELKDCQKFWDGIPYGLDIINLGSNSAKFAFNYEGIPNTANLAMGPQCLLMDFNILKAYKDHISKDAIVFISLCPFSSMAGYNYFIDSKYHTFLPKENIPNYSKKTYSKMMGLKNNPINTYPLMRLFVDIRNTIISLFARHKTNIDFQSNAHNWIGAWKNEFDIIEFEEKLSEENAKNYRDSASILKSLYSYCMENGWRTYVILPPISQNLSDLMPSTMRKSFIEDYLSTAGIPNNAFLNFMECPGISDNNQYFQNAYFLNEDGGKAFTKFLLKRLNT